MATIIHTIGEDNVFVNNKMFSVLDHLINQLPNESEKKILASDLLCLNGLIKNLEDSNINIGLSVKFNSNEFIL